MILETGETKLLVLGVVFGDYRRTLLPGIKGGTVGYHTYNRNIYAADYADGEDFEPKKTRGSVEGPLISQKGLSFQAL